MGTKVTAPIGKSCYTTAATVFLIFQLAWLNLLLLLLQAFLPQLAVSCDFDRVSASLPDDGEPFYAAPACAGDSKFAVSVAVDVRA